MPSCTARASTAASEAPAARAPPVSPPGPPRRPLGSRALPVHAAAGRGRGRAALPTQCPRCPRVSRSGTSHVPCAVCLGNTEKVCWGVWAAAPQLGPLGHRCPESGLAPSQSPSHALLHRRGPPAPTGHTGRPALLVGMSLTGHGCDPGEVAVPVSWPRLSQTLALSPGLLVRGQGAVSDLESVPPHSKAYPASPWAVGQRCMGWGRGRSAGGRVDHRGQCWVLQSPARTC